MTYHRPPFQSLPSHLSLGCSLHSNGNTRLLITAWRPPNSYNKRPPNSYQRHQKEFDSRQQTHHLSHLVPMCKPMCKSFTGFPPSLSPSPLLKSEAWVEEHSKCFPSPSIQEGHLNQALFGDNLLCSKIQCSDEVKDTAPG